MLSRPTALVVASAAAFLFAAMLLWSSPSDGATGNVIGPTQSFDPCGSFEVASTAPGVSADITSILGIGIGPDCIFRTADDDRAKYNFGGIVTFTPEEWGVAAGDDLPAGTKIGTLSGDTVLGLFNNTCRTELFANFDLLNGSIDISQTISPKPPGEANRLSTLADDSNGNGIPDGAEKWPAYLTDTFDFLDLPSTLHARIYGQNTTAVPGDTVIFNFLIFKPGTQVSELVPIDPRLGYPSVTVLNDPTAPASPKDPINDFCAPTAERTTLLGTAESGDAFRTTPTTDGAYPFVLFATSQRDADGDGIENRLDTCAYTTDPDWNPRDAAPIQNPGDKDGDLIPDSCDPFPEEGSLCTAETGLSLTDEDCDGWMNGADNCPLVPNPDQEDTDSDDIGDACDQNPTVPDGEVILVCRVTVVQVGAGGTPAYDPETLTPCDPTAPLPSAATPTPGPGETPAATGTGGGGGGGGGVGGVGGGPESGVGSRSPVGSSMPLWAFAVLAAATIGLLAGLRLTTRKIRDRRRVE